MGRRFALEQVTGSMDLAQLPQHQPARQFPIGDAETFVPYRVRDELTAAIAGIAQSDFLVNLPLRHDPTLGSAPSYDASGIYELVAGQRLAEIEMEAGTRVIDASFPEGVLAYLVRTWQAVPLRRDAASLALAREAKRRLESEAQAAAPVHGEPFPGKVLEI